MIFQERPRPGAGVEEDLGLFAEESVGLLVQVQCFGWRLQDCDFHFQGRLQKMPLSQNQLDPHAVRIVGGVGRRWSAGMM